MWKKNILVIISLLVVLLVASFLVKIETQSYLSGDGFQPIYVGETEIEAYYFYGQGCPSCNRIEPFITEMKAQSALTIYEYEIYYQRENFELLNQFFDMHEVPTSGKGVPALFVSGSYFVGDETIRSGFEEAIDRLLKSDSNTVYMSTFDVENSEVGEDTCDESEVSSECLSLVTLTTAALVDSVSPCSLAALLFLVGVRPLVRDPRKRALKVGLAFSISVFFAYTLFGLGLLSVIGFAGFSSAFGIATGLVAILAGLLYVKDYFWHGDGRLKMEVPGSLKFFVGKMVKGVTSPLGVFLLGFLVCFIELPCTGGPYFFILGQLANTATRFQAIPLLLYYNVLFVTPLLLATLFLYFGIFSIRKASEWNSRNKGLLRLISGLTLIALGVLVVPSSEALGLVQLLLHLCIFVIPPVLLTLCLYLAVSTLHVCPARVKLLTKTMLMAILPIISVLAYYQFGIVRIEAANVASLDMGFAANRSPSMPAYDLHSREVDSIGRLTQSSCFTCTRREFTIESEKTTRNMVADFNLFERTPNYKIMLKSREFVPETGVDQELISALAGAGRSHVMVQFKDIPTSDVIQALKTHGVELLDYLPYYAYFASVPAEELHFLADYRDIRSVISIELNDKVSPFIRYYGVGSWARNEDGTVRLMVVFFEDTTRENRINVIETYGKVDDAPQRSSIFMASIPESSLVALAAEDSVQWIEVAPPEKVTNMDQARGVIGADVVQASPYNLDGTGVTVAMWDSGRADPNHDDFMGRIVIGDGYGTTTTHSTHVAGIMAGDGILSSGNMRGVAINSNIRSYEWPDTITELDSETLNAITNNAILSQNSWSFRVDPPTYPCSLHGDYDAWSQRFDEIINGDLGDEIVVVGAAGNEENDGDCAPYPWNQTNPPICPAKNSICVGAIYSDTLQHTCFSSRGPTDDGRLKPDIVAPGDEANDSLNPCLTNRMINATEPGDSYGDHGGTSMSAPMVSGAVALLRQQFSNLGYGEIKPHTFKAVLVQSADDLGNPGPDYTYGHGNLDIQEAVDLAINNYPNNELIRTGSVIDDEIDYYYMSVPSGAGVLRVTLVWDDIEGTPAAAKELVNDLDLYLRSPSGTYYYAYRLDPANPGNNAGTGWNDLDNVEVVEVVSPEPGKWTIGVWGWIVTGTEEYTVVAPYEDINCGDYIYHDTALGHDLSCIGNGLGIGSSSITLDCQGHIIQGNNTGIGIQSTYSFGTIQNCVVRDFDTGIYLYSVADYNHILNNDVISNDYQGIYLDDAWSNEIRENDLISNGVSGGNGLYLSNSRYNDILYNYLEGNNVAAIGLYSGCLYNAISYNGITLNLNDGVKILSSNSTTISFNNITESGNIGVYIYESHFNDLLNNYIDGSGGWSLYLLNSNDNEVADNYVNHPHTFGVYSSNSYDTLFNNNVVCGYSWDFYTPSSTYTADENMCDAAYVFHDSGQASGCDFECSGCRKAEDDLVITEDTLLCPYTYNIEDLGSLGAIIIGSENVELNCQGAEIIGVSTGSGWGIKNPGYDHVTIRGCVVQNYFLGIAFELGSDYANIVDNDASWNSGGIRLWGSNYGELIGNTANNNTQHGLILTQNSQYNLLRENRAEMNNMKGISVHNSDNNIVELNHIMGNDYGIYLTNSLDNLIFHNMFVGNVHQAYTDLGNTWDDGYPSGGNFWSDYAGGDSYNGPLQDVPGSDGIGDTPYPIDVSNKDRYPIMNPHDVGISTVTTSKTVVGKGYDLEITVTVVNYGIFTEDCYIKIYANAILVASQSIELMDRDSAVINFIWDTTAFSYDIYTVSAVVDAVPDETLIANNSLENGNVMVTIPGDVNGDRIVDIFDVGYISAHWFPGPPVGPLGYGANADVDGDGAVDIFDIGIASAHWGQNW